LNERLLRLAQRISDELNELERIIKRSQEAWRRFQQHSDDLYMDAVALNLHSLYSGVERLFELIATTIDNDLPQGANWHRVLLERMSVEIPSVRPAVISEATCEALDEYRGFRHVVRHAYTFQFDAAKMQHLVERIPTIFTRASSELLAFGSFLKQCAESS